MDDTQACHFHFDRPLCYSNVVTFLSFSKDGRWLFSASSSGAVKVWDTERWVESARLKGCRGEEPIAVEISPSQRWLAIVQRSCMHIYRGCSPWTLERKLSPDVSAPSSKWCFAAFSPFCADEDYEFAALSTSMLSILDCSNGWTSQRPRRSQSFSLASARVTGFVFTACGLWLVCSYADGRLEVWSTDPLAKERTLRGHAGAITCLRSVPKCAGCDPHVITCGADGRMCIWNACSWDVAVVDETRSWLDRLHSCTPSTDWLVTVGSGLIVWRCKYDGDGELDASLHQRLEAADSMQSFRAAAFCGQSGTLVSSSGDGALSLWSRRDGPPASVSQTASLPLDRSRTTTDLFSELRHPTRPMRKVSEPFMKAAAVVRPATQWTHRVLSRPATPVSGMTALLSRSRSAASCGIDATTSDAGTQAKARGLSQSSSASELRQWSSKKFDFEAIFSQRMIPTRGY